MRDLLDRGGILLTANARAARALDRRFAEGQQAQHIAAWPTPRILDLHSWLTEQWNQLLLTGTEDRLLLNNVQEHAAWQRITMPLLRERSLIEPARMASLAQEAYALLAAYGALGRLDGAAWMSDSLIEHELFRRWARSFQEECIRRRWLPSCELIDAIAQALRWGALTAPSEIGWLGFDRDTPSEQALVESLQACGTQCHVLKWEIASKAPPKVCQLPNEAEETAACAAWVLSHLDGPPAKRIGILMPDLAYRRAQIERAFYRRLAPEALPITAGAAPILPFEFSLGLPLAQVPLIHAALLLLRWLDKPLTQQEISWLLLSSTLGSGQGSAARDALAQWDARLRNANCTPPEMSLPALLRQPRGDAAAVDSLHSDLSRMLVMHRRDSRPALAGQWTQRVRDLLHVAQWGASSDASSLLFQAREAWEALLDTVASLDIAARSVRFEEFLAVLERTARETIFAPESADAPVQVMGAYAASGQAFDAVWFLGATDTAWPTAGHPHPLLSLALQRGFEMPHTSPSGDQALAHRVTERILGSAGEAVFSYALQTAEAMQRGSSLISNFATFAVDTEAPDETALDLELVPDDIWVPLPRSGVESSAAPGGQTALKRQADCPFQAFVFQRLRVRELPIAGRGLSPMERGKVLHQVLEGVWAHDIAGQKHLRSHADLVEASASQTLRALVNAHMDASFRALGAETSERWQRAYLAAERERVVNLVMEWLNYECGRHPFVVAAVEKKITVQVGDLALNVRADRIDRVKDGHLLIDYKTGDVSPASWEGERPEQPQLPLYAAFGGEEDLVGALFAQVRQPRLVFKGRAANPRTNLFESMEENGKQIAPYTSDGVEEWREVLMQLADCFVRGEAAVDPHIYPKTCRFCPLSGVCRVAELRASGAIHAVADEEEDAE